MMADKMRAILPITKAFNEMRAKAPIANGKRAAAFNLNNKRRGNNIFFVFFPLPRAGILRKIHIDYNDL
jgi:hypothetical protein